MKSEHKGPAVNDRIRSNPVRLIDADGEMRGVVPLSEALSAAQRAGLDLVEIVPNAEPPVCKVMDFGKHLFDLRKKEKEAKKKQKVQQIKELKIRVGTDVHDYEVKKKAARRFIEDGDKVKITLRFRGREMAHQDLAEKKLQTFWNDLSDIGKLEVAPKLEGRQMVMIVVPQ